MTEPGRYQDSMGPVLVSLVDRAPGASHAVLASVEGLPIAVSAGLPPQRAEQLAGIGVGLLSLADGAGQCTDTGPVCHAVVEMAGGVLLAVPLSAEMSLTVLAVADCDRERLGYAVAEFSARIAPQLR